MPNHRQAPASSVPHNAHRRPLEADLRSAGGPSALREYPLKRPRHDGLDATIKQFRPEPESGAGPSLQARSLANSTLASAASQATNQDDIISPNLESMLDDYDLGINEEERRRRTLEESRRRRQAILEKHRGSVTPDKGSIVGLSQAAASRRTNEAISVAAGAQPSAESFSLIESGSHNDARISKAPTEADSAAEQNPDADRAEELARLDQRRQTKEAVAVSQQSQGQGQLANGQEDEYEEVEVTDDESEEEMDMFALSDDEVGEAPKKKTKVVRRLKGDATRGTPASNPATLPPAIDVAAKNANLASNWDDSEGYLRIILGETLDDRYQIFAVLGKGMFASVVRARDLRADGREVAIKIIRVQESMYKAGLKEVRVLRELNESDPDDRKHVVRLERHFDYKGHLCMVFESLAMNLRDVVKRYGRDVGLNMQAVRAYTHQLFLALSHLAKNLVMHADIKPDNILVNDSKALLKLCDFGSASYLSEMEITPYLVSRFYRAPEIILGQAYDCSIDVWSIGCTLYELATGRILFPGRTNNNMMLLMQELRGRFTTKQLRKSQFGEQHFDETNAFLSMEQDKSTKQSVVKRVMLQKPTADLRSRLLPNDAVKQLKTEEIKTMNNFIDLLERCLELDPAKRIKPKDALEHPFLAHVRASS